MIELNEPWDSNLSMGKTNGITLGGRWADGFPTEIIRFHPEIIRAGRTGNDQFMKSIIFPIILLNFCANIYFPVILLNFQANFYFPVILLNFQANIIFLSFYSMFTQTFIFLSFYSMLRLSSHQCSFRWT